MLGETMTLSIHSEFNWPLADMKYIFGQCSKLCLIISSWMSIKKFEFWTDSTVYGPVMNKVKKFSQPVLDRQITPAQRWSHLLKLMPDFFSREYPNEWNVPNVVTYFLNFSYLKEEDRKCVILWKGNQSIHFWRKW